MRRFLLPQTPTLHHRISQAVSSSSSLVIVTSFLARMKMPPFVLSLSRSLLNIWLSSTGKTVSFSILLCSHESVLITTSGLTLFIISGSLLALMLWQLTFTIFKLGFSFTDLGLGTFSGDNICSGLPGKLMEPIENADESCVVRLSRCHDLNREDAMFCSPQLQQSHMDDCCPSLYSVVLMSMHDLCNHSSHPSHCSASSDKLTLPPHTAHGNTVLGNFIQQLLYPCLVL